MRKVNKITVEKADIKKLIQRARTRGISVYIQHHTTNGWSPADNPCRDGAPVDTMPVVIRAVSFIEIAELYPPVPDEVKVGYHDPHERREED